MAQTMTTGDYIQRRLRPMSARLRISDTLLLASRTLWIGLAGGALVQIAGRLWPLPNLLLWSLIPPALWLIALLGYLVVRPLPLARVAQRLDTALNLRERLATALELSRQPDQHPLDDLQQADARAHADTLRPRMLPLHVDRRRLAVALVPLLVIVAAIALPNPQNQVLQERAEVRQVLEQTANQIQQLEQRITQDQTLTPAERAQLEQQLSELERQLRANPGNREQALADITTAEAQLQQHLDPRTDARRAALEQLSRNLEGLSGRQPSQPPSLSQTAQQLGQLAQQLGQMSPEQRQQLAQNLNQQAGQMSQSDPQTAQNLANAAQALQQGNTPQAQQSLNQAAQSVQQAQQQQADQQAVQQSLSQVQQGRQDIAQAGQQAQQAQQGQQAQPQGQQAQQGQQNQQGQPQGQQPGQQDQQAQQGQQGQEKPGQQGQGEAKPGQGGQQGQGDSNNQGGGGSNIAGSGQQNAQSGGDPTKPDQGGSNQENGDSGLVYQPYNPNNQPGTPDVVQGQQGPGGESQVQQGQGNLPGANNPSLVPYQQVLPQYQQSAGEALDQSAIPPHLKNYVRDYFSQLEPAR
jgi:hypothetical protein